MWGGPPIAILFGGTVEPSIPPPPTGQRITITADTPLHELKRLLTLLVTVLVGIVHG